MTSRTRIAALTLTTALVSAGFASAEQHAITDDQIAALDGDCRTLAQYMTDNGLPDGTDRDGLMTALQNGDQATCTDVLASMDDDMAEDSETASATDSASDSETVTETATATAEVSLTEEALARVRVPEPEVDVDVPAPNVRVSQGDPSVTIDEGQSTIEVAQERPTIAVEIPEIIVRVEIPAPKLYVRRSDPSVQISSAEPQIEVEQGDPTVSVRQGKPELSLDLDVEDGDETRQADAADMSDEDMDGQQQASADGGVSAAVNVSRSGEPQVELVRTESQPRVEFNQAQAEVSYEAADPQIDVQVSAEPKVEIARVGNIEVIYETDEERQARRNTDATGDAEEQQPQRAAAEEQTQQPSGEIPQSVTVAELMDMTVVGANGDDFGSPTAFVTKDSTLMMVISEGGFLGLGDTEIGVPVTDVVYTPEHLQLREMTDEQIEEASNFEYSDADRVSGDVTIELR